MQMASASEPGDISVDNVREAMQAAFSAVDNGDVLEASFDHLRGPAITSTSPVGFLFLRIVPLWGRGGGGWAVGTRKIWGHYGI